MATKKKEQTKSAKEPKKSLIVEKRPDELEAALLAKTVIRPEAQAAITLQAWTREVDTTELCVALSAQIAELDKGDMKRPESILLMQAHTLDGIFNNLARRAKNQEYLNNFETMLRLALKAQTQCGATLETLATIKNPPIIYAKQANFANGHQQVNNGAPLTHARETKNQKNELLTELPHETLDTGRTGETITANQAMAALD